MPKVYEANPGHHQDIINFYLLPLLSLREICSKYTSLWQNQNKWKTSNKTDSKEMDLYFPREKIEKRELANTLKEYASPRFVCFTLSFFFTNYSVLQFYHLHQKNYLTFFLDSFFHFIFELAVATGISP